MKLRRLHAGCYETQQEAPGAQRGTLEHLPSGNWVATLSQHFRTKEQARRWLEKMTKLLESSERY